MLSVGRKDDQGKRRWSLLPWGSLEEVVKVLEFGAKKYGDDNWQQVDRAVQRYRDALIRHCVAWFNGQRNDPESGLHHLAHAACCCLFLLWFEARDGIANFITSDRGGKSELPKVIQSIAEVNGLEESEIEETIAINRETIKSIIREGSGEK